MTKFKCIAFNPFSASLLTKLTANFTNRLDHMRNTETQIYCKETADPFLKRLQRIETIFKNPSVSNLHKLIGSQHLNRKLPMYKSDLYSNLENHIAQLEIACLAKILITSRLTLTSSDLNAVVTFCCEKTSQSLGSEAECFTLYLKDLINGIIQSFPPLESSLLETVQLRREFYAKT